MYFLNSTQVACYLSALTQQDPMYVQMNPSGLICASVCHPQQIKLIANSTCSEGHHNHLQRRLHYLQEALQILGISSTHLEPSQVDGGNLHAMMTTWQARWPSSLHADPLATLAVVSVRQILLGLLLPLAQKQGALSSLPALQSPTQSPWEVSPSNPTSLKHLF